MSDKLLAVKDNGLSGLAIQRIEAADAKTLIGVPDVDDTLAVSGAAAEAKVTGDAINTNGIFISNKQIALDKLAGTVNLNTSSISAGEWLTDGSHSDTSSRARSARITGGNPVVIICTDSNYLMKVNIWTLSGGVYSDPVVIPYSENCVYVKPGENTIYGASFKKEAGGTISSSDRTALRSAFFIYELLDINTALADIAANATNIEKLSGYINESDKLPDYVKDEIFAKTYAIQDYMEPDAIVLGMFTDLHYPASSYKVAQRDNTCFILKELGDKAPLDFTVDGGDLYDGSASVNTYDNDRIVSNRVSAFYAVSRCPHFVQSGDHDRNQKHSEEGEKQITTAQRAGFVMPYMQQYIVRPKDPDMAKSLYYYYDVPNKNGSGVNTRYISIANAANTMTVKKVYSWLKNEVFTEDVKAGWQFIVCCHIPVDLDSLCGYRRGSSSSVPTRLNWNYHTLFDCINSATAFTYDYSTSHTVYFNDDGHMMPTSAGSAETIEITGMGDNPNTDANPGTLGSIDFTGWTSKVRLVISGHNHCDRFGYLNGGEIKSYITSWTAMAEIQRPDSTKTSSWYLARFGTERSNFTSEAPGDGVAWWSDTADSMRTEGTLNEYLIDLFVVNSTKIKRFRFGIGRTIEV